MQGDFSRVTFDPDDDHDYRAVLMQQGRVLLDADWNEQAERTAHRDDERIRDLLGPHGGVVGAAGFAVVGPADAPLNGTPWADLHLKPGHYYVQGVRCALPSAPVPLAGQPHFPGGPVDPAKPGKYELYLDTWTRQVTADEEESLGEPALGGPDTTTRAQTVWQVRIREFPAPAPDPNEPTHNTMAASLAGADAEKPGSYTRLDNQLYRVQIHDPSPTPTFLWSRENGSVAARLTGLGPVDGSPEKALLTVDRVGRDESLSIGPGDVVEVTSRDRELRGEPGHLATVDRPEGLSLPVTWQDAATAPKNVDDLGGRPVVRRWEKTTALPVPRPLTAKPSDLEGDITVEFPAVEVDGHDYRTGDYWLIPARAVQMAYGLPTVAGTIVWPPGEGGKGRAVSPHGPVHRTAPIALLERGASDSWTLVEDRRLLAPPLTGLLTLDIADGDGQQADGNGELERPVRVIVRNGGVPVPGVQVRFDPGADGTVDEGGAKPVTTDEEGMAWVTWRLATTGKPNKTLTISWADADGTNVVPRVFANACRPPRSVDMPPVTITVNPQLVAYGLEDGEDVEVPQWRYGLGTSRAPSDEQVLGWMPIVLPDRYRITSFRMICTDVPPLAFVTANLYRQSLTGSAAQPIVTVHAEGSPDHGLESRLDLHTSPDGDFPATDGSQFSHLIDVNLTGAAGTSVIAVQVACEPAAQEDQ